MQFINFVKNNVGKAAFSRAKLTGIFLYYLHGDIL